MKKIIILLTIGTMLFSSCRIFKLAQFSLSENHQKPRNEFRVVEKSEDAPFTFQYGDGSIDKQIANMEYTVTRKKGKKTTYKLDDYLNHETRTTAFIVIRNDSILFERYYDGFDQESLLPSFSVAKSFTSSLMGIAVDEGYIDSEEDLVIKYLPELKGLHPYWEQMTLKHLLNMRSGLKFNENNYINPYSTISSLYISNNVMKLIKKMKFSHQPGTKKYYSSLDTELLGIIIERATKATLAEYLEQKIWQPLGMESSAKWDIDSDKAGNPKAFCCLNAVARDYAKFARLFLKGGMWKGKQVISKDWVAKSTIPDFSNGSYQYQWYSTQSFKGIPNEQGKMAVQVFEDSLAAAKVIEKPLFEQAQKYFKDKSKWIVRRGGPEFYALGIFGQEVYVNPENEMIFVRLGERWDTPTRRIFRMIEEELDK